MRNQMVNREYNIPFEPSAEELKHALMSGSVIRAEVSGESSAHAVTVYLTSGLKIEITGDNDVCGIVVEVTIQRIGNCAKCGKEIKLKRQPFLSEFDYCEDACEVIP